MAVEEEREPRPGVGEHQRVIAYQTAYDSLNQALTDIDNAMRITTSAPGRTLISTAYNVAREAKDMLALASQINEEFEV